MTALEENQPVMGALPSDPIVLLVRRICLLREQGRAAEARQLEHTELSAALKRPEGAGEIGAEELARLYRIEAERAANAVILSEMIVTRLDGHFTRASAAGQTVPPAPPGPISIAPETAGGAPAIPDLLDAMLAHDRTAARRHSASSRPGAGLNHNPTTRST